MGRRREGNLLRRGSSPGWCIGGRFLVCENGGIQRGLRLLLQVVFGDQGDRFLGLGDRVLSGMYTPGQAYRQRQHERFRGVAGVEDTIVLTLTEQVCMRQGYQSSYPKLVTTSFALYLESTIDNHDPCRNAGKIFNWRGGGLIDSVSVFALRRTHNSACRGESGRDGCLLMR